jgi:hypothetical protein
MLFSGSGSSWTDITKAYQIQIDDKPLALMTGNVLLEAQFENNLVLLTTGLREVQPLRVSWQRAKDDWPRAQPRVLAPIRLTDFEQWLVLAGTVKGINAASGELERFEEDLPVRDDLAQLRAFLALVLPYYRDPDAMATWRDRGNLDISNNYRSGAFLSTVTRSNADDGEVVVGGTITRSWVRVAGHGHAPDRYDTVYQTQRLRPEWGVKK